MKKLFFFLLCYDFLPVHCLKDTYYHAKMYLYSKNIPNMAEVYACEGKLLRVCITDLAQTGASLNSPKLMNRPKTNAIFAVNINLTLYTIQDQTNKNAIWIHIRKKYLYNEYPLKPRFYIL